MCWGDSLIPFVNAIVGVAGYLSIDDVSFDVLPVARIDALLHLTNHTRTNITAFDRDFLPRIMIRLSKDLGLAAAPTGIVEDPRVGIDGRKQSEELKLPKRKGCANCFSDVHDVRQFRRTRLLILPIDVKVSLAETAGHGDNAGGVAVRGIGGCMTLCGRVRVLRRAVTRATLYCRHTTKSSLHQTPSPPTMPSNKSFRTKVKLAKAARQNRPVPQWIRLRYSPPLFPPLPSRIIPTLH